MTFALLVPHRQAGLMVVHEIAAEKFGHPDMTWVDVSASPGVEVGWVQNPDGSLVPYVPALDVARAERLHILRLQCRHTIVGGFASTALGAPFSYESDDTDQTNIDRAAFSAFTCGAAYTAQIPCIGDDGVKAMRVHTGKQATLVAADLHRHTEAARVRFADLKAALAAATTVEAVAAVQW